MTYVIIIVYAGGALNINIEVRKMQRRKTAVVLFVVSLAFLTPCK